MSLGADERLEAAALAVRRGWINRTGLCAIAFRHGELDSDEIDGYLARLEHSGRLETRVGRYSGRHGRRTTRQYRATSPVVAPQDDRETEGMVFVALHPDDVGALRALVDDQLHNQAHLVAELDREAALRWLRISADLAPVDPNVDAADAEVETS